MRLLLITPDIVALCDANFVEALGIVLRSCDAPI